ncbi:hypothetical protein BT69DRAFT_1336150 [Atractiella rhizophila]|nr:hypothetical protein BT69DRAFT_1336150 [Atractiella rhizophila]
MDGPGMDEKTKRPWHQNRLFPPYRFFDIDGREERDRFNSIVNRFEANMAVQLYARLQTACPSSFLDYQVGVVAPYKGQMVELRRQFRARFGQDIVGKVDFNTVDGFQGQEKDIIILSLARGGNDDAGVGFLKDTRRMNVALTRARASLFILGNSKALRQNEIWKALLDDAQERNAIQQCDKYTFSSDIAPSVNETSKTPVPSLLKASPRKAAASKTSKGNNKPVAESPIPELFTPGQFSQNRRSNSALQRSLSSNLGKRELAEPQSDLPRKRPRDSVDTSTRESSTNGQGTLHKTNMSGPQAALIPGCPRDPDDMDIDSPPLKTTPLPASLPQKPSSAVGDSLRTDPRSGIYPNINNRPPAALFHNTNGPSSRVNGITLRGPPYNEPEKNLDGRGVIMSIVEKAEAEAEVEVEGGGERDRSGPDFLDR